MSGWIGKRQAYSVTDYVLAGTEVVKGCCFGTSQSKMDFRRCSISVSVRKQLYLPEPLTYSCRFIVWVMSDGQNEGCFLKFMASVRKHIDLCSWFAVRV